MTRVEQKADPVVLLDCWPEDDCVGERGWVEVTVSKERACELIRPFCEEEAMPDLDRVVKVTLAPIKDPAAHGDDECQRWHSLDEIRRMAAEQLPDETPEVEDVDARLAEAREFWEVQVA